MSFLAKYSIRLQVVAKFTTSIMFKYSPCSLLERSAIDEKKTQRTKYFVWQPLWNLLFGPSVWDHSPLLTCFFKFKNWFCVVSIFKKFYFTKPIFFFYDRFWIFSKHMQFSSSTNLRKSSWKFKFLLLVKIELKPYYPLSGAVHRKLSEQPLFLETDSIISEK